MALGRRPTLVCDACGIESENFAHWARVTRDCSSGQTEEIRRVDWCYHCFLFIEEVMKHRYHLTVAGCTVEPKKPETK